jgi:hypothetical protein
MFDDPNLRTKLKQIFLADTDRFDELIVAAGIDPKKDLIGADLRGADFAGSVMDGWDLSRCDLTGASFSGAKIRNLVTRDAIGADLQGVIPFDDTQEEIPLHSPGSVEWIVDEIRKSKTGAQRGPLIKTLIAEHSSNERAWHFLLDEQLRRERVGRLASMIIDAWASTQPSPESAGIDQRFRLLRKGGNSYIMVRAKLLRELAVRLGRNVQLLDLCREIVRTEGYWSSGTTALSILADVFAGQDDVRAFLVELIAGNKWSGFRYQLVPPILKAFDAPSVREVIEAAILNSSFPVFERTAMVSCYYRAKRDDPRVSRFLDSLLESTDPSLRAAVVRAKGEFLYGNSSEISQWLVSIVSSGDDDLVRVAAVEGLAKRKDQVEFLRKTVMSDTSDQVRTAALQGLHYRGYKNPRWYSDILKNDAADSVRSAALGWLQNYGVHEMGEDELRYLLLDEIAREPPGTSTGEAAGIALQYWPTDSRIRKQVRDLIPRLPEELGNWRARLSWMLRKFAAELEN